MRCEPMDGAGSVAPPPPPPPPKPKPVPPPPKTPAQLKLRESQETKIGEQTKKVATARAAVKTVQSQRSMFKGGLRAEYDDMVRGANADLAREQKSLADLMVPVFQDAARTTTPRTGQDVYQSTREQLAKLPVDASLRDDLVTASNSASQRAIASPPTNANEARWQTLARIDDAEQSQYALEKSMPKGCSPDDAKLPDGTTVGQASAAIDRKWAAVAASVASERALKGPDVPGLPSYATPSSLIAGDLKKQPWDARYVQRIDKAIDAGVEAGDPTKAIGDRVTADVAKVRDAARTHGSSAAFDAYLDVQQRLKDDPPSVQGIALDDAASQSDLRAQLTAALRPQLEAIAKDAPKDLSAIASQPHTSPSERLHVAEAVSTRLDQYSQNLPQDLVAGFVNDSQSSWKPALSILTEPKSLAQPQSGDSGNTVIMDPAYDHAVDALVRTSQTLAIVPGGDKPLHDIGTVLVDGAQQARNDALSGAFRMSGGGPYPSGAGLQHLYERIAGDLSGDGRGPALAVELMNQFGERIDLHAEALAVGFQLKNSIGAWAKDAKQHVLDFAKNREPFEHYVANFVAASSSTSVAQLRSGADPRAIELNDAVSEYRNNHPEVFEKDAKLLADMDRDAVTSSRVLFALDGLKLPESSTLGPQRLADPVTSLLTTDGKPNDLARTYAGSPSARAELRGLMQQATHADAQGNLHIDSGGLVASVNGPDTLVREGAAPQGIVSVARNGRFFLNELVHESNGVKGVRTSVFADSPTNQGVGALMFTYAAAASGADALSKGNPTLDDSQRAVAGMKSLNYGFLASRDIALLGKTAAGGAASMKCLSDGLREYATQRKDALAGYLQQTGTSMVDITKADGTTGKVKGYEAAENGGAPVLARTLMGVSRGLFVVTDAATLAIDANHGRSGSILFADGVSLAGSTAMLAEFGLTATVAGGEGATVGALGAAAGPVGWIGAGLWFAGTAMKAGIEFTEKTDRFETADQRRFLAHIGTVDANGVEKPAVTGEEAGRLNAHLPPGSSPMRASQVSDAVDHDPTIGTYDGRQNGNDQIVYRGISAGAVDALMNYSKKADSPTTIVPVLGALANDANIDPRTLLQQWFDGRASGVDNALTPDQQKELVSNGNYIDPTVRGVSAHYAGSVLSAWATASRPALDGGPVSTITGDGRTTLTADQAKALFQYVDAKRVYGYTPRVDARYDTGQVSVEDDMALAALGQGPVPAGHTAPSEAVKSAARTLLAGVDPKLAADMHPDTVDDLKAWMKAKGYPPIEVNASTTTLGPAPAVAPAYQPQHDATVQPDGNLWTAARAGDDPQAFIDAVRYHNAFTLDPAKQFDLSRMDGRPDTPAAPGSVQRDPDLVRPGDVLRVFDLNRRQRA